MTPKNIPAITNLSSSSIQVVWMFTYGIGWFLSMGRIFVEAFNRADGMFSTVSFGEHLSFFGPVWLFISIFQALHLRLVLRCSVANTLLWIAVCSSSWTAMWILLARAEPSPLRDLVAPCLGVGVMQGIAIVCLLPRPHVRQGAIWLMGHTIAMMCALLFAIAGIAVAPIASFLVGGMAYGAIAADTFIRLMRSTTQSF